MSTTTTPRPGLTENSAARAVRLGALRIGYEVRAYFRQGDTVFFTFLFPVVMLTIFSVSFSETSFGQTADGDDITAAWFFLPAMLAAGVLLSGLQNLAIDIAMEKSDGTLKRLAGSPLPVVSYFIGKLGQSFVTGLLQAIVLLALGFTVFQVPLPDDASKWWTFAWVFALGVITSAILGIALSAVPRSGKSATAVVIPITLVLQFISGVYLRFSDLPEWLQNVAAVFPLKWMAQGMRSVFLPDELVVLETNESWDLPGIALALGIWLVVGLIVTRLTFRWIRKDS
ncbi:ABC transporter permease [Microcella humidisoli]|uniref:ABC transporter permease n=1 Tax=Microcella humidisoli TaxID=2963406 RepID=A0ABY5FY32_9MICO|nr:ABC transporter permease [Microcella humidisoli]UTT63219.1 ABC transporter permease [Microcella humidisoli]